MAEDFIFSLGMDRSAADSALDAYVEHAEQVLSRIPALKINVQGDTSQTKQVTQAVKATGDAVAETSKKTKEAADILSRMNAIAKAAYESQRKDGQSIVSFNDDIAKSIQRIADAKRRMGQDSATIDREMAARQEAYRRELDAVAARYRSQGPENVNARQEQFSRRTAGNLNTLAGRTEANADRAAVRQAQELARAEEAAARIQQREAEKAARAEQERQAQVNATIARYRAMGVVAQQAEAAIGEAMAKRAAESDASLASKSQARTNLVGSRAGIDGNQTLEQAEQRYQALISRRAALEAEASAAGIRGTLEASEIAIQAERRRLAERQALVRAADGEAASDAKDLEALTRVTAELQRQVNARERQLSVKPEGPANFPQISSGNAKGFLEQANAAEYFGNVLKQTVFHFIEYQVAMQAFEAGVHSVKTALDDASAAQFEKTLQRIYSANINVNEAYKNSVTIARAYGSDINDVQQAIGLWTKQTHDLSSASFLAAKAEQFHAASGIESLEVTKDSIALASQLAMKYGEMPKLYDEIGYAAQRIAVPLRAMGKSQEEGIKDVFKGFTRTAAILKGRGFSNEDIIAINAQQIQATGEGGATTGSNLATMMAALASQGKGAKKFEDIVGFDNIKNGKIMERLQDPKVAQGLLDAFQSKELTVRPGQGETLKVFLGQLREAAKLARDIDAHSGGTTQRLADDAIATYQGKLTRVRAAMQAFETTLGNDMLPTAERFATFLYSRGIPAIEGMIPALVSGVQGVKDFGSAFSGFTSAATGVIGFLGQISGSNGAHTVGELVAAFATFAIVKPIIDSVTTSLSENAQATRVAQAAGYDSVAQMQRAQAQEEALAAATAQMEQANARWAASINSNLVPALEQEDTALSETTAATAALGQSSEIAAREVSAIGSATEIAAAGAARSVGPLQSMGLSLRSLAGDALRTAGYLAGIPATMMLASSAMDSFNAKKRLAAETANDTDKSHQGFWGTVTHSADAATAFFGGIFGKGIDSPLAGGSQHEKDVNDAISALSRQRGKYGDQARDILNRERGLERAKRLAPGAAGEISKQQHDLYLDSERLIVANQSNSDRWDAGKADRAMRAQMDAWQKAGQRNLNQTPPGTDFAAKPTVLDGGKKGAKGPSAGALDNAQLSMDRADAQGQIGLYRDLAEAQGRYAQSIKTIADNTSWTTESVAKYNAHIQEQIRLLRQQAGAERAYERTLGGDISRARSDAQKAGATLKAEKDPNKRAGETRASLAAQEALHKAIEQQRLSAGKVAEIYARIAEVTAQAAKNINEANTKIAYGNIQAFSPQGAQVKFSSESDVNKNEEDWNRAIANSERNGYGAKLAEIKKARAEVQSEFDQATRLLPEGDNKTEELDRLWQDLDQFDKEAQDTQRSIQDLYRTISDEQVKLNFENSSEKLSLLGGDHEAQKASLELARQFYDLQKNAEKELNTLDEDRRHLGTSITAEQSANLDQMRAQVAEGLKLNEQLAVRQALEKQVTESAEYRATLRLKESVNESAVSNLVGGIFANRSGTPKGSENKNEGLSKALQEFFKGYLTDIANRKSAQETKDSMLAGKNLQGLQTDVFGTLKNILDPSQGLLVRMDDKTTAGSPAGTAVPVANPEEINSAPMNLQNYNFAGGSTGNGLLGSPVNIGFLGSMTDAVNKNTDVVTKRTDGAGVADMANAAGGGSDWGAAPKSNSSSALNMLTTLGASLGQSAGGKGFLSLAGTALTAFGSANKNTALGGIAGKAGAVVGAYEGISAANASGNAFTGGIEGAISGASALSTFGPVGTIAGGIAGLIGGALGNKHLGPAYQPDIYDSGYGQLVANLHGTEAGANGVTSYASAAFDTLKGNQSLSQQLSDLVNGSMSQYTTAQQSILNKIKNLGGSGTGGGLDIADEKNGVFTLTSGKTVSVSQYQDLVNQASDIGGLGQSKPLAPIISTNAYGAGVGYAGNPYNVPGLTSSELQATTANNFDKYFAPGYNPTSPYAPGSAGTTTSASGTPTDTTMQTLATSLQNFVANGTQINITLDGAVIAKSTLSYAAQTASTKS